MASHAMSVEETLNVHVDSIAKTMCDFAIIKHPTIVLMVIISPNLLNSKHNEWERERQDKHKITVIASTTN